MSNLVLATMSVISIGLMCVVFVLYFLGLKNQHTKPNPTTWLVWSVVMVINILTYTTVTSGNWMKAAALTTSTIGILIIFIYSKLSNRFARLTRFDVTALMISGVLLVAWKISENAVVVNLILQLLLAWSFIPTAVGLIRGTGKEYPFPWLIATMAYIINVAVIGLSSSTLVEFVSPFVNGVLGNGVVGVISAYTYYFRNDTARTQ